MSCFDNIEETGKKIANLLDTKDSAASADQALRDCAYFPATNARKDRNSDMRALVAAVQEHTHGTKFDIDLAGGGGFGIDLPYNIRKVRPEK